ncbi:hypothetical protein H920_07742 [Fukomys damarensis]|uniref:Uncharacterized protein n=1 Tax=Fukomys damarensis TaxID=885580 RepID=A0A091DFD0_FUKDA|nr:hypothetical protein H920_07742 [Fukomys damarensis]
MLTGPGVIADPSRAARLSTASSTSCSRKTLPRSGILFLFLVRHVPGLSVGTRGPGKRFPVGPVPPGVASASLRHRAGLSALPRAPWRNPGQTGGHTESFPPASLAWRLLGSQVAEPLPAEELQGCARGSGSLQTSVRTGGLPRIPSLWIPAVCAGKLAPEGVRFEFRCSNLGAQKITLYNDVCLCGVGPRTGSIRRSENSGIGAQWCLHGYPPGAGAAMVVPAKQGEATRTRGLAQRGQREI